MSSPKLAQPTERISKVLVGREDGKQIYRTVYKYIYIYTYFLNSGFPNFQLIAIQSRVSCKYWLHHVTSIHWKIKAIWSIATHWNSLKNQNMTDDWPCLGVWSETSLHPTNIDSAICVLEDQSFAERLVILRVYASWGDVTLWRSNMPRWRILELNGDFQQTMWLMTKR